MDDKETPHWYQKHYTCVCGHQWWDEWDCLCSDRCPFCNKEIECDDWEEISLSGHPSNLRINRVRTPD